MVLKAYGSELRCSKSVYFHICPLISEDSTSLYSADLLNELTLVWSYRIVSCSSCAELFI